MAAMASVLRAPLGVNNVRAVAAKAKTTRSVRAFAVVAENRLGVKHWLPGTEPPAYLDGTMAGDYGFDPLRLGTNPETLPYLQEAELMNGRWAMAATAGILFTDAVGLPKFWEAGEVALGDWDIKTLVGIQVVVMGALEAARIRGFMATGQSGIVGNFPFDPAKQDSPASKVKEVKNARLAMMAFLGMVSQYAVTGTSPLEGLKAHMANPTGVNIFTSAVGNEFLAAVIFLSIAPVYFVLQEKISDGSDDEFRPIPW
eukprot:CAMPEP_0197616510 /NCGR_PEP_ID=MMETSP1326-20131121/60562_1 /TAXON_ID=1155430 /ORGANISM="Genus nov. species nov., Strain RCC2288" /LENGTH=256 /DNA_ID=CAMNT_0043185397 /DNA_START=62 /DNA_END=832 /DNA_ORIENTATION=+